MTPRYKAPWSASSPGIQDNAWSSDRNCPCLSQIPQYLSIAESGRNIENFVQDETVAMITVVFMFDPCKTTFNHHQISHQKTIISGDDWLIYGIILLPLTIGDCDTRDQKTHRSLPFSTYLQGKWIIQTFSDNMNIKSHLFAINNFNSTQRTVILT